MRRGLSVPPAKAAALFIDLQEEHRRDERYLVAGFDRLLANARLLQHSARINGVTVIHAAYIVDAAAQKLRPFHPVMPDGSSAFSDGNSALSEICEEVGPQTNEIVIVKAQAS